MLSFNDELPDVISNMLQGIKTPVVAFTADQIDSFLALTPVDNITRIQDTRNWLSNYNGQILKNLINISYMQSDVVTSFGLPNNMFTGWLKPLVKATREAVASGRDPDPVVNDNIRIETAYAARLKRIVTALTKETRATQEEIASKADNITHQGYKLNFDDEALCQVRETPAGQAWLLSHLFTLQNLEWQYHSYGQTRLRAMKKLLRSLLQVIADEPFSDLKKNPYRKLSPEGQPRQSTEDYIAECRTRLLALAAKDAFDVRRFALESPASFLGACHWEVVKGSELYSIKLRHYPRPEGVKPNGKTLYMASPMINRCELFDLAPGKSVIEGMLQLGYDIYMVDYGNPGPDQSELPLSFYSKDVHDKYIDMLLELHPEQNIEVMAYCMGGTLFLPYLARKIEELNLEGGELKIRQLVLMTAPVHFDDETSGHKPMRDVIREHYSPQVMQTFYSKSNVPPQTIEVGMHAIQPGVAFSVAEGFYARASFPGAINSSAPFMHWLNAGTRFPARAHQEWIQKIFLDNEIWEGKFELPSKHPELDGKPVNMDALNLADVAIFDYRGQRDPIAPVGSCLASERWGRVDGGNTQLTCGGLNRTIERNVGHIFVVSKKLLAEFLETVTDFLADEPPPFVINKTADTPDPCPAPETKPVEAKPVETKPVETKPVETKPVETKPVETKPVETKPVEAKPVEAKPVEAKPVEAKPVEAKPVEAKPVEAKPVEAKPVEAKPVETKPVEAKPVEAKPVEAKPVETKPVETKPVEAKPVEAKPVEAKPVEAKPVETKIEIKLAAEPKFISQEAISTPAKPALASLEARLAADRAREPLSSRLNSLDTKLEALEKKEKTGKASTQVEIQLEEPAKDKAVAEAKPSIPVVTDKAAPTKPATAKTNTTRPTSRRKKR